MNTQNQLLLGCTIDDSISNLPLRWSWFTHQNLPYCKEWRKTIYFRSIQCNHSLPNKLRISDQLVCLYIKSGDVKFRRQNVTLGHRPNAKRGIMVKQLKKQDYH